MNRHRLLVAASMTMVIVAVAAALLVDRPEQTPYQVAARVSAEVMSPYCEGVTLRECASPQADALREQVLTWAGEGLREPEIMARLVSEYDAAIVASPGLSGSGLWAWLGAALIVAGALFVGATRMRRFAPTSPSEISPGASRDAPPRHLTKRLEQELEQLRQG